MRSITLVLGVAALAATPSLAHEGPRIWIGNMNGRIGTFASDDDFNPTAYTPSRLFSAELESFFGIFTTEFPGFEVRRSAGNVMAGTTFGFNLVGSALFFDEVTEAYIPTQAFFGPPHPGPVPQLAVSLGAQVVVTGPGSMPGFAFFTHFQSGDHSHLSYTLLGDGSTASDGPAGVYALSLELTSPALTTSEVFYLLVGKDVTESDPLFQTARLVAEATLLTPSVAGDLDCSGQLNPSDVGPFVMAVVDPLIYAVTYPGCAIARADMNRDGLINGADIQSFVEALLG